jgi:UDP-GlcNAc:undecaprenyl-phosphate/decaprenyl-phosphate GlcNAc-1-phosphate transferase
MGADTVNHLSFAVIGLSGVLSLAVALVAVPAVRKLSLALGFFSQPRSDRWNSNHRPKALFGGVAIAAGFWTGLIVTAHDLSMWGWKILLAGNIVFALIGLLDDLFEFRPVTKVLLQLVASLVPIGFGLKIPGLNPVVSQLLAMTWIVVIVNAVNLLDNMDGLAGGIAAIAAFFLLLHGLENQNAPLALAAAALGGSCVGFLFYNFPPSSIFMGDTGSHFLGYSLAALTLLDVAQPRTTVLTALVGPALVLLVPIFDTALVAVTRFSSGRSVTAGAADHSSHRLVSLGLTERQTALVLYAVSLASGVVSLLTPRRSLALLTVLGLLFLLGLYYFGSFLSRVPIYARTPAALAEARRKRVAIFNAFVPHKWSLLDLVADFAVVLVAHVGAYLLRFEGRIEGPNLHLLTISLPIVIAARLLSFQFFGLYRGVAGHFSIPDVLAVAKAVLTSSLTIVTILVIVFRFEGFSRAVMIIDGALTFGMVVVGHASVSFFSELLRGRGRGTVRTVIVGAGELGSAAARLLRRDQSTHHTIVAYLDDDPRKIGRHLHGVSIEGPVDRLREILERDGVDEVVIASSRLADEKQRTIRALCDEMGLAVRRAILE